MIGKVPAQALVLVLVGCGGTPLQGAEAEGLPTIDAPAAITLLHAGEPFLQTTWGPDVTAADVAAMSAALPSLITQQQQRKEAQDQALDHLEEVVGAGSGSVAAAEAAVAEVDREFELFLGDLDAVARLGASLSPSAWAMRARHGPVAILLLAVTDHPLAHNLDPFARLGSEVLTRDETRLVVSDRARARRARSTFQMACVALVPQLRGLGVATALGPETYRSATREALAAWRAWRGEVVVPFATFMATLPSPRRQELVGSGAFRRAVYPTAQEVAARSPDPDLPRQP